MWCVPPLTVRAAREICRPDGVAGVSVAKQALQGATRSRATFQLSFPAQVGERDSPVVVDS